MQKQLKREIVIIIIKNKNLKNIAVIGEQEYAFILLHTIHYNPSPNKRFLVEMETEKYYVVQNIFLV